MNNAIDNVISKISEFLDIFDLSFFISGVVSFSAIYFGFYNLVEDKSSMELLKNPTVIVISSYVLGMIGFALGRGIKNCLKTLRDKAIFISCLLILGIIVFLKQGEMILNISMDTNIKTIILILVSVIFFLFIHKQFKDQKTKRLDEYKEFDDSILNMIKEHGLDDDEIFEEYVNRNNVSVNQNKRILYRLYVRLWAEIRESGKNESYKLIKRYWILNAVYDGLLFSSTLWLMALLEYLLSIEQINWSYIMMLGFLFGAIFTACINESKRLEEYQMQDLIASIAVKKRGNSNVG